MRLTRSTLFGFAACLVFSTISGAELQAGAGSRTITPDLAKFGPVFMAGFDNNRRATSIHDDLYARCMAIQPVANPEPLVICGVDLIGLFWEDVERIREATNRKLGYRSTLIVAALHDHEGPDTIGLWGPKEEISGINEDYNAFVVERTSDAAIAAVKAMEPVKLKLAKAHPEELDNFIADNRPPVVHDAEVLTLSAMALDGKPVATLLNWANHPETLGSDNQAITSDYPGFLRDELEKRLGGVAVFINGAVGGMQSPLGAKIPDMRTGKMAPDDSFRKAEIIGRRVADIAADATRTAKPVSLDRYQFREKLIPIMSANEGFQAAAQAGIYKGRKPLRPDSTTLSPIGMVRFLAHGLPELEIALIPGELYPELSVGGIERYSGADFPNAPEEPAIKKTMMKAPFRMLFGLADDEIGYIIPKAEWDNEAPWLKGASKRWYGEVNSSGPETAPVIIQALQELFAHP